MKTVRITMKSIGNAIHKMMISVVAYFVVFHGWVSYFFLEENECFDAWISNCYSIEVFPTIVLLRWVNVILATVFLLMWSKEAREGDWWEYDFEIKVPSFTNERSKTQKEIDELLMKAASLCGEGKDAEADRIYDKIQELNEQN